MKNIKKILFLIFILFLTGCSVKYNLEIYDDGSVNEEAIVSEKTIKMESMTKQKGENAIKYLYDMFKRDDSDDVKLTYKTTGNMTEATASISYDSMEEYSSKFKSDIIKNARVTKSKGKVTISMEQNEILGEDNSKYVYDNIEINIKVPFEVVDSNADKKEKNVYTWYINRETDLKTIKISYKDGIKNSKSQMHLNINNKIYDINYAVIVLGVILVLLLIFGLIVFIKNKKNNYV